MHDSFLGSRAVIVRFAKLILGFSIGLAAGYALCVMRPEAEAEQPMEDLR